MLGTPVELRKQMDVREAAEILGCSEWLVRKLVYSGELKSRRVGRLVRFDPADLAQYLERSRQRIPE
jgi:excisionase family DNA binding protein